MAKFARQLWQSSQQWRKKNARLFLTAGSVSAGIIVLRALSLLQMPELSAIDLLLRLRPTEATDERIVIIAIDQKDLNQYQWPLSDQLLADLLKKIDAQNPAVVGLDIIRDRPIGLGTATFQSQIQSMPHFVGIEALDANPDLYTKPLEVMWKLDSRGEKKEGVGFNNLVLDTDGVVRRNILYWGFKGTTRRSFALQLAQVYLKSRYGVLPEGYPTEQPQYVKLKDAVFFDLRDFHSPYGWLNPDENYQIISNMRDPDTFKKVSLSAVLSDQVPEDIFKDRVVLIGSVSENTKDFFLSPFSDKTEAEPGRISGVDIHANFASEMLQAALNNRPLLRTFTYWQDVVWIFIWAIFGAGVVWRWRSPIKGGIALILGTSIILSSTYLSFITLGWLFPVVPCLLALMSSAVIATIHIANQAKELSRSREFFHLIIDNIPDPVFVKDIDYKLTVVNEAFCQLIKTTETDIIGKTDYDIFTADEASIFHHQEASVLETSQATENEEILTNLMGETFAIATKRSLHRDGAGNIFLVGVIRDITERKKLEADLRRTAEELTRSNDELKKSEEHLRRLANHDPLTGLPNRKHFNEKIQQLIKEAAQEAQLVSLLFLDLDGFKPVNDNFGHDMGDILLKAVAHRIKNCLRATDIVSRLGGDEFTVLLPCIKRPLDSSIVAQKILKTVSSPYMLQGHQIQITVSIGISVYPFDNEDTHELIKLADQAMYEAKRSGRNQYKMTAELEQLAALAPQI